MREMVENALASYLAPQLVGALARTVRVRRLDTHNLEAGLRHRGRIMFALFHGRMFLPVWLHRRQGYVTLVSQSRDGELVARVVHAIGHHTLRGSSHRGGSAGLRAMVEAGKTRPLAMMVDGPRGPRHEPKPGTIAIARLTGLPIVPIAGATFPNWELGSWDRFQLPKPFSRGVVAYGAPLIVPKDAKGEEALEQYRLELKRSLLALVERADRAVRRELGR
ncbi:MAG: hypothetical protein MAG453_00246 [Calditrichaeota bacterium]|nr:hypothetical protein [Calditrichota bacterium]